MTVPPGASYYEHSNCNTAAGTVKRGIPDWRRYAEAWPTEEAIATTKGVRQVPPRVVEGNRENGANPLRGRRCNRPGFLDRPLDTIVWEGVRKPLRAESQKTCLSCS